ncbi:MAG: M23 family metallopeptidase [Actinomycetota bacterium]
MPASAHNTWTGGYRKWPWRADTDITLGTLPGECPHCPGRESSSAWKAIDAGMNYDTVYSIAPGTVNAVDTSGGSKAGKYIRIKDADGSYITYEHLNSISVSAGAAVVGGQPIGVSGETGNVSGPHLHFQRHDGASFSSNALDLIPISGHGGSGDALTHSAYASDNAGIGYSSGNIFMSAFNTAYRALGGYSGFGVTANLSEAWSPCRTDNLQGWYFRYGCSPNSTYGGNVQTYFYKGQARALMLSKRSGTAYAVTGAIYAAYTDVFDQNQDWVSFIGYPVNNRHQIDGASWRQDFEGGYVITWPANCITNFVYGPYSAWYGYCD